MRAYLRRLAVEPTPRQAFFVLLAVVLINDRIEYGRWLWNPPRKHS